LASVEARVSAPFELATVSRRENGAVAGLLVLGGILQIDLPTVVAGLCIVAIAGIAVSAPLSSIAATIAAIPLIYYPAEIGSQRFSLLEIGLVASCLGVGISLLRERSFARTIDLLKPFPSTAIAAAVCVLGAFSIRTIVDQSHRTESLRDLRVTILEPVALLLLARWAIRRERGAHLAGVLMLSGVSVGLAAVIQMITGQGEVIGDGVRRATGPYPHPNNLAFYLERVALFVGAIALLRPRRRVLWLALGAVALGLALTFSRGAVLAVLAGGIAFVWIAHVKHGWRWIAGGGGAIVALFAAVAGDRLWSSGSGGNESSRELIWRASIEMIKDHPIFGLGLDQFYYQYAPRYVDPAGWSERYTSHPHNVVLDVWLRLGIAGLVVLAAALALLAIRTMRLRAETPSIVLPVAAATMLIGGLAHGLVDNSVFLPDLAAMTWLGVAFFEKSASDLSR
jgi:O-antigen ligase